MIVMKPFFLTNTAWYSYNTKTGRYELKDGAPLPAIDSYESFYNTIDSDTNEDLSLYQTRPSQE